MPQPKKNYPIHPLEGARNGQAVPPAGGVERPPRRTTRLFVLGIFVAVFFGAVVFICAMVPILDSWRTTPSRMLSMNNCSQIALALLNYESRNGSFPPAYFIDENGNRTVSWRVLVLADLGEQPLYDAFDRSQAWNEGNNRKYAKAYLSIFNNPRADEQFTADGYALTNYVVIVGDETPFPGSESVHYDDISDDLESTILVVEILDSDIAWAEPRDLTVDEILERVRQGNKFKGPNRLGNAFIVAAADRSVYKIDLKSIDPETFRKFLTRAGGEAIDLRKTLGK